MMGSVPKDIGFGLVNVPSLSSTKLGCLWPPSRGPNNVYFHIHNKKVYIVTSEVRRRDNIVCTC